MKKTTYLDSNKRKKTISKATKQVNKSNSIVHRHNKIETLIINKASRVTVIQRENSISSRIISPITRVILSAYHQTEFVDSLGFILIKILMICKMDLKGGTV